MQADHYLTTPNGRKILLNTLEEDAIVTAAALSDPDALPLTDEEWKHVHPMAGWQPESGIAVGESQVNAFARV